MTDETVVKKKKPVNGKKKGSGFELAISKILTKELAPLQFKRSQGSGAIVGGQNSKLAQNFSKDILRVFVGDVCPINETECDKKFRFVIETKFYKERENITAILNKKSSIYAWMDEARFDSKKLDIEPILIFKYNNSPTFACVDSSIDLPDTITYFTLSNRDKICDFDELIKIKEFWLI